MADQRGRCLGRVAGTVLADDCLSSQQALETLDDLASSAPAERTACGALSLVPTLGQKLAQLAEPRAFSRAPA